MTKRGLTAAVRLQNRSLPVRAETSPRRGRKGGRLRALRRKRSEGDAQTNSKLIGVARHQCRVTRGRYLDRGAAPRVERLESTAERLLRQTYERLTPWQKVQVARHPQRPHCLDCIQGLITEFVPLAGDRTFGEDAAVVGGIGRFRGRSVVVLGTEKGADTETRLKHNFGMARPDGY